MSRLHNSQSKSNVLTASRWRNVLNRIAMNRAGAAASVQAPMAGEARVRTVINAEDESVSPLYAETLE
jgi:hypothetical protein